MTDFFIPIEIPNLIFFILPALGFIIGFLLMFKEVRSKRTRNFIPGMSIAIVSVLALMILAGSIMNAEFKAYSAAVAEIEERYGVEVLTEDLNQSIQSIGTISKGEGISALEGFLYEYDGEVHVTDLIVRGEKAPGGFNISLFSLGGSNSLSPFEPGLTEAETGL